MPELPEVELCRRQLENWLAGRRVTGVRVPDRAVVRRALSTRPSDALEHGERWLKAAVIGKVAAAPIRHGKRLGWSFEGHGLLLHLGMTGRWVRRETHDAVPHGRLALETDDSAVWFIDTRRFGCVAPCEGELEHAISIGLGPDALCDPLDAGQLRSRLQGRRAIKVALLDQKPLAGLGNIHAVEALFRARLSPLTRCDEVSDSAWRRLSAAIPIQLQATLDAENGDELVYVTQGGPNLFAVYGRRGEPCRRCGTAIDMRVMGGRATYWCPGCQTLG